MIMDKHLLPSQILTDLDKDAQSAQSNTSFHSQRIFDQTEDSKGEHHATFETPNNVVKGMLVTNAQNEEASQEKKATKAVKKVELDGASCIIDPEVFQKGKVKFFDQKKQFGFIEPFDKEKIIGNVFFHFEDAKTASISKKMLRKSEKELDIFLEFQIKQYTNKKNVLSSKAINIRILEVKEKLKDTQQQS